MKEQVENTKSRKKKKNHISTHLGLRVRRQPLVGQFLLHQISTGSSLICHTFQEEAIKSSVRHFWSVSSSAILPRQHSCKLGGSAEKKEEKKKLSNAAETRRRYKKCSTVSMHSLTCRARHRPSYKSSPQKHCRASEESGSSKIMACLLSKKGANTWGWICACMHVRAFTSILATMLAGEAGQRVSL